jgi:hypothetical protein
MHNPVYLVMYTCLAALWSALSVPMVRTYLLSYGSGCKIRKCVGGSEGGDNGEAEEAGVTATEVDLEVRGDEDLVIILL